MKLHFKARSRILLENMKIFNDGIMEKMDDNLLQLWYLIFEGMLPMFMLKSNDKKCVSCYYFPSLLYHFLNISVMFISWWVSDTSQGTKMRIDWSRHWRSLFEYSKHQLVQATVWMITLWLVKNELKLIPPRAKHKM